MHPTGNAGTAEAQVKQQVDAAVCAVARTVEQPQTVAESRRRIDDLDDAIIELIQLRMTVSAEVQRARLATGGRRLSLSREMEILARYREALGTHGTAMAMALLELCRGRAPLPAPRSS
jgi:chorismate mutase